MYILYSCALNEITRFQCGVKKGLFHNCLKQKCYTKFFYSRLKFKINDLIFGDSDISQIPAMKVFFKSAKIKKKKNRIKFKKN